MDSAAHPAPTSPRQRVARSTHPLELQRLALQEERGAGCDPLTEQAVIWLFRAYNAAVTAQVEALRPLGLSPSAFNVLMALCNTPGQTLEPRELAERLLVTRPSMSGLLDTLQAKGLIRREPHAEDGRRILVVPTDRARALLQGHAPRHYAAQKSLFADLSADEVDTLVELLRRVRGATPEALRDAP